MSFNYLLEKIAAADFEDEPFRHIEINNFFSKADFEAIVSAPEIAISGLGSDAHLFDSLFENGYKIIDFPGCITDRDTYMRWHQIKDQQERHNNSACEGFGITLRLMKSSSDIISKLNGFLNGQEFQDCLTDKFGISRDAVRYDAGIQKYLDGYEISPHPDIRQKALTYMVNINPHGDSDEKEHHTHYLEFRPEYKYVQAYWEGNADKNRCWVPWGWCNSVKMQRENNSIVIFSPGDATMHGVKADYDHLAGQRTQLYGNLWYTAMQVSEGPEWEDLVLTRSKRTAVPSLVGKLKAAVPVGVKDFIKARVGAPDSNVVPDRLRRD